MRLLLGVVTSAAVYAGTRIVAGAVGGAVLGVLLTLRAAPEDLSLKDLARRVLARS